MARYRRSYQYRRAEADSTTMLLAVAVLIAFWWVDQPRWLQILVSVSVIVAALGFWALFRMPVSCGVANRSKPTACRNRVRGMLSACHLPDHRAQKWRLVLARLRRRPPAAGDVSAAPTPAPAQAARPPQRTASPSAARAGARPTATGSEGYWLDGAGYRLTTLVATVLGGIGGVAGVVSTVNQLVGS